MCGFWIIFEDSILVSASGKGGCVLIEFTEIANFQNKFFNNNTAWKRCLQVHFIMIDNESPI